MELFHMNVVATLAAQMRMPQCETVGGPNTCRLYGVLLQHFTAAVMAFERKSAVCSTTLDSVTRTSTRHSTITGA
eukprot:scaffold83340_cov16-Prasinocladus_malaysianus.AAC.1